LRAEIQDLKVHAQTAEESAKKAKSRLKEMEEVARKAQELEVQLAAVKAQKGSTDAARDKRSDELDMLRAQNAELSRKLDEAQAGFGGTMHMAGAAAAGAAGGAAAAAQIAELQSKVDNLEKDHKKDKKKAKKVQSERDEIAAKAAVLQAEVARAKRDVEAMSGRCVVIAKLRRPSEPDKQMTATPTPEGDALLLREGDKALPLDVCFGASSKPDEVADECKSAVRAVAKGFNVALVTIGPMGSGKTFLISQVFPTLVKELVEACDASSGNNFRTAIESTCLEFNCDGIFDLYNPDSMGQEIQLLKDPFGSVVAHGAGSQACGSAHDIAVDFKAALGRRRKQRSHVLYCLHVRLIHKVTQATVHGSLTICDLAGQGALGDQPDVESAKYVNKSAVSLNKVLTALTAPGQSAVPYRDDALTMGMCHVLGGNCRTIGLVVLGSTGGNDYESALQAVKMGQNLAAVKNSPLRQFESADLVRLRQIVADVQSPEEAAPKLTEIVSLRE